MDALDQLVRTWESEACLSAAGAQIVSSYLPRLTCARGAQDLAILDQLEAQHHAAKRARLSQRPQQASATAPAWQGGCTPQAPAVPAQQPLAQLWPQAHQQQPGPPGALPARPCGNAAAHAGGGAWLTGVQRGRSAHSVPYGAQHWSAQPCAAAPAAAALTGALSGWDQGCSAVAEPGSWFCSGEAGSERASADGAAAAAAAPHGAGLGNPAWAGAGLSPGSEECRLLPGGHTWRPGPAALQAGAHLARAASHARQTNLLQGGRAEGAISALHAARHSSQARTGSCFHTHQPDHSRQS